MVDVLLMFDEQEDFNNVTLYLQVSTMYIHHNFVYLQIRIDFIVYSSRNINNTYNF